MKLNDLYNMCVTEASELQRRRFGEELGEKVDWRRDRNQFSLFRFDCWSASTAAPDGFPNIGEKSVNKATRKSRDRVMAEDNIFPDVILQARSI